MTAQPSCGPKVTQNPRKFHARFTAPWLRGAYALGVVGATHTRSSGPAYDRATIEELPPLSVQRAFVVQFRSGSGLGRFAGRVEHIPSAHAARFGSKDELLAFLTRVLAEVSE
jgi:hypothetical protein